jgi:3-methyladenine DNA glycosylase AlkD
MRSGKELRIQMKRRRNLIATLAEARREVRELADPQTAEFLQRYFRAGPGGYGEGDRFLGIRVPQLRRLARRHRSLAREEMLELLRSPWHEERLLALLLLVERYRLGAETEREVIFRTYLSHTRHVNNWDLVDASAEQIVGARINPDQITVLERLASSESLWERRIAILSTFHWIKRGEFRPTLRIAELLAGDSHDLIQKAVGWMLREVGKREFRREEEFLRQHYRRMPRTMLRYAIERFPEVRRRQYLRGEI